MRTVATALSVMCWGVASAASTWQNWFGDPFFIVRSAVPHCPVPAGPFTDERGRQEQSHHRAEKGTTCWLAGACDRPKSYHYDEDIAEEIRQVFSATSRFEDSSLWITVQGRVVYIEGCAGPGTRASELEAFVAKLRYVERAVAIVRTDAAQKVPYTTLPP